MKAGGIPVATGQQELETFEGTMDPQFLNEPRFPDARRSLDQQYTQTFRRRLLKKFKRFLYDRRPADKRSTSCPGGLGSNALFK